MLLNKVYCPFCSRKYTIYSSEITCFCGNVWTNKNGWQVKKDKDTDRLQSLLEKLRNHSKYMVGDGAQCVMCGISWSKLANEIEAIVCEVERKTKENERLQISNWFQANYRG